MSSRTLIARIMEHWPVKVLSVALALILFIFNRLNTQVTRLLLVPLTIETRSMLVPASAYPASVRVNLRGDDEAIRTITEHDLEAYVDLLKYETAGSYNASVQIRRKGTALTIEPLEIAVSPMKIAVQLDKKISKTLPLAVAIRGRVAEGFDLVSHSINPTELEVTGPLGRLESVSELKTEPIDLDGRNRDFTLMANIANPDSLFTISGDGTAEVSGIIRLAVLMQTIEGIPISLRGLDSQFEASIGGRTGSVRIQARQSQLDAFQPGPGFMSVDCSGIIMPGSFSLPVNVDLPQGFSLIRHEPSTLTVTVTLKEAAYD